jgi:hypothetical protein
MRGLATATTCATLLALLAGCGAGGDSGATSTAARTTGPARTTAPATTSATPTPSPTTTSPSPTPSAASPTAEAGVTYLTFTLVGTALCPGGLLGAHNTTVTPTYEVRGRIGTTGALTLKVATKYTRHLAFDISCAKWPNTGAVPIVALQYPSVAAGQSPVTTSAGKPTATFGSYCWAGTTDPQATFTVHAWIDKGDGTPLSGTIDLWADPMVSTVAISGTGQRWEQLPLGHQDEPTC